jgi:hypothetical protein
MARKVINLWLRQVVPSIEGGKDGKFDKLMTHQKCDDARKTNPNFTTCGSLPGWLFTTLGIPKLANYGLKGVKDAASDLGCWVDNPIVTDIYDDGTTRPLPGDVYLVSGANTDEIKHIGVIVNPYSDRWWTADAGQGEKALQQAWWVPHWYDSDNGYLDAVVDPWVEKPPHRILVGWVDLDLAKQLSS